jgi:hypothetical protein
MPRFAGVLHGAVGFVLFIAGFIALSISLSFMVSMRDEVVRTARLSSSGLNNLMEAGDLAHTWSDHCRLFPQSRLRWKVKFALGAAFVLCTLGIVLLLLGI